MSHKRPDPFKEADVFHIFDVDGIAPSPSSSTSAEAHGNATINEVQYQALVQMIASNLGLTTDDAERLFPSHKMHENADDGKEGPVAADVGALSSSSSAAREPPLCAHLAREGAASLWSDPSANLIPDVRCCDARDVQKAEPFPATGHGPHVHCLYCCHSAFQSTTPPVRGVPPPIVTDFRDSASLQAHQREHRNRYLTYLKLLEDGTGGSSEMGTDMLSDEGLAVCEAAAEEAGRHACYMAAMGTPACPIVVFYCAECDSFAPLVRLHPTGDGEHLSEARAWSSTEELNVILSRLLLCCHLLYMMDLSRFSGYLEGAPGADGTGGAAADQQPRHILYLFKPILFHEGVEEEVMEEFESDAECTYAAAVLPNASVIGAPAELLLLDSEEDGQDGHGRPENASASSQTYSPAVIGFAMEWASEALAQSKLDLLLRQHELGKSVAGAAVVPFRVATRWVYVEDTEEWVRAHVLHHRTVATRDELPRSYVDGADEGIRVVETYAIDTPMPEACVTAASASAAAAVVCSSDAAIVQTPSNVVVEDDDDEVEDPLALDGCPYSMESRTIDFFVRMTALAKAMHELAAWRLSIDENKQVLS
ncbi:hypothetical protein ABB37_05430 [Leptomonas pyrrhocoris]|uniref:Uncharacterized protein n=1 Tax=Leptomonas pyrrhocoris TaxID=157538 RepID=A0A0M9G0E1_LEPPY|nr:hypothetical protein ABB37_05430 [Leptomonas pyrrhocoris]XP_015658078.1 hypothetical protein ABB37_05430 [Leptomonas pyrrhocoris]XP_015658079.1 hypothetical protein ABB37_05430 [Leptomonas pyrrhocoris]KPA79638.1 hypothetical protein ABB37_05430 [Leptomonas pyrrhocoris]KPA79639.1 hypothetical protein ABB37_05430 [Leptomonas pyrrhocoris]KPA79640.1 hypothetical protein ABB37_05430 [Leptomonas pyrrhocoris]|eukprot:XP_015658077.1 hypothetical protein ABB37_05430 [Leptomonas pyrrhocoris]